ncbi:hypothetical protein [Modicisalibacter coralii]|uniref:hypothetical protein n=1 Tax=Modicisalibacter coralii TaxID=2304602 RepID=UPI00100B0482|nr:hypothetical protein [Halomonas coralii]
MAMGSGVREDVQNDIIVSFAKAILEKAVETRESLVKYLILISSTSIPIYLSLLDIRKSSGDGDFSLWALTPVALFLTAMIMGVYMMIPKMTSYDLKYPEAIIERYFEVIRRAKRLSAIGGVLYILGIFLAASFLIL